MFEQAESRDNKRRDKDKDANGVIATSKTPSNIFHWIANVNLNKWLQ